MTVPSPCTGVCRLTPNGARCVGCSRTMAEISAWIDLTDEERLRVLEAVRRRHGDGAPS